MRKIEQAAQKYDWTQGRDYPWGSERPEQIKVDCFIAGARWFAEQMTSRASVKAGAANGQRCSPAMASNVLRAVRKEIEGE